MFRQWKMHSHVVRTFALRNFHNRYRDCSSVNTLPWSWAFGIMTDEWITLSDKYTARCVWKKNAVLAWYQASWCTCLRRHLHNSVLWHRTGSDKSLMHLTTIFTWVALILVWLADCVLVFPCQAQSTITDVYLSSLHRTQYMMGNIRPFPW